MDLDATLRSLPGGSVTRDLVINIAAGFIILAAVWVSVRLGHFIWKRLKVQLLAGALGDWVKRWLLEQNRRERFLHLVLIEKPVAAMAYLADQQQKATANFAMAFCALLVAVTLPLAGASRALTFAAFAAFVALWGQARAASYRVSNFYERAKEELRREREKAPPASGEPD